MADDSTPTSFFNEDQIFELDVDLYSPSLLQKSRLSIKRRIYNPWIFPFLGFFLSFCAFLPMIYNFFQLRRWFWLTTFIVLLPVIMISVIMMTYSTAAWIGLTPREAAGYLYRICFTLSGILAYGIQRKDYEWFIMAGGEERSTWKLVIALIILMVAIIYSLQNL